MVFPGLLKGQAGPFTPLPCRPQCWSWLCHKHLESRRTKSPYFCSNPEQLRLPRAPVLTCATIDVAHMSPKITDSCLFNVRTLCSIKSRQFGPCLCKSTPTQSFSFNRVQHVYIYWVSTGQWRGHWPYANTASCSLFVSFFWRSILLLLVPSAWFQFLSPLLCPYLSSTLPYITVP